MSAAAGSPAAAPPAPPALVVPPELPPVELEPPVRVLPPALPPVELEPPVRVVPPALVVPPERPPVGLEPPVRVLPPVVPPLPAVVPPLLAVVPPLLAVVPPVEVELAGVVVPPAGVELTGAVVPPAGVELTGAVVPPVGIELTGAVVPPVGVELAGVVVPPVGVELAGVVVPPVGVELATGVVPPLLAVLPPAPAAPPGASELHPIARLAAQKHAASKTKDGNLGDSDESLDDIDTLPCFGFGEITYQCSGPRRAWGSVLYTVHRRGRRHFKRRSGWRSLSAGLSSICMPKLWASLLAGSLVALTASGCSVDRRSLGSLTVPLGEAGTAADVFVQPVDGSTDSQNAPAGEVGPGPEVWVPFGPPSIHPAFTNAGASQADPTLTADELELYFSSNPNTDWDIWLVQRASITAPWGTAARVDQLSSTSLDETPEVSADGLTIYLASDRTGGVAGEHLWVSHRATRTDSWPQPVPVTDFVGGDADISPSLQRDQLMMVFASQHGGDWDLYMTTRPSTAAPWGPPTALTQLNSTAYDWDPAVYRGGNSIVFASRRLNTLNSLFHATRGSAAEYFSAPQLASEFDVLGNAADPWLSDDGHHIVFDTRGGPSRIYEAWR